MRVTILGCGSSNGVPTITGNWGVCDPKNPKNRRRRPSILLEKNGFNLLIDTSTDLREQLLDAKCKQIDAVLYTHEHADHVMGIDDLRAVRRQMKRDIEVFAASEVIESLKTRFGYLFSGIQNPKDLYRPIFNPNEIVNPNFQVGPFSVKAFSQDHGICSSLGFKFGPFAYSTDVVRLSEASLEALEGTKIWIVDCLRDGKEHPTHANLKTTLKWIERINPQKTYTTHMNTETDYEILNSKLPKNIEPAYDGLVLKI